MEKRTKGILREVIRLRNTLQPVNRLPPEIIALCAAFVPRANLKPIVSLTHVCRYWRGAITSSSSNWTLIGNKWARLAPLCLERAGAAPLTITISAPGVWERGLGDFFRALFPHTTRISHLSLAMCSTIERETDKHPGLFASMPGLTSLEHSRSGKPAEWFPSNETPIPPLFWNVSKLTSLRLTQTPLYSTLFNIASLVELRFDGREIHFQKFLGFLESNHSLEIVVLELEFVRGSVLTSPERMVSLPRLRHLALTCKHPINARGLLSCLSFPRGVNIEVRECKGESCGNLTSFLPRPPTPIQDLLAPITTMKSWPKPEGFHLSGSGGSFSFCFGETPRKYDQEFDLFATDAVRQVHISLDIWLGYRGLGSRNSWPFKRLPALEVLVISGYRRDLGPLAALTKDPALCPSLKTIALLDYMGSPEAFKDLESMLTERENSTAARLHRIVIANKTRDMPNLIQSIGRLRKLAAHVDIIVGDDLPDLL